MAPDTLHLTVYKPQQFVKERQLNARYGNKPSRKELKRFNRYWNSEQRQIDEHTQYMYELNKMFDSVQRNMDYLRTKYRPKPLTPIPSTPSTPSTPSVPSTTTTPVVVSIPYWEEVAKQNGFNSMQEVAEWQAKNGLVADGMFGNRSKAKKAALNANGSAPAAQPAAQPAGNTTTPGPVTDTSTPASNPTETETQPWTFPTPKATTADFYADPRFRKNSFANWDKLIIGGKVYPALVTKASAYIPNLHNDETYVFDPETGMVRRVAEDWLGNPTGKVHTTKKGESIKGGKFAEGSEWVSYTPQK